MPWEGRGRRTSSSGPYPLLEEERYCDRYVKPLQPRYRALVVSYAFMLILSVQKEAFGALVSLEMGKIRTEGVGEVQEFVDIVRTKIRPVPEMLGLTCTACVRRQTTLSVSPE